MKEKSAATSSVFTYNGQRTQKTKTRFFDAFKLEFQSFVYTGPYLRADERICRHHRLKLLTFSVCQINKQHRHCVSEGQTFYKLLASLLD